MLTPAHDAPRLNVCEIFTSIQGEGLRTGAPSTFVRLLDCNLACRWCDTTYSWKAGEKAAGTRMTPEAIAAELRAADVVLTGGEPLLQDLGPLLALVGNRHVTVETNATIFQPQDRVDLWSLSPKLGSSGHKPNKRVVGQYLERYPDRLQLKFVVEGAADLASVQALLSELPRVREQAIPLILQPVGRPGEPLAHYLERFRALIEQDLLADDTWNGYAWRALPQLHRLIWGDARGV